MDSFVIFSGVHIFIYVSRTCILCYNYIFTLYSMCCFILMLMTYKESRATRKQNSMLGQFQRIAKILSKIQIKINELRKKLKDK